MLQLVIAAAAFKPLEQILTIDILNDRTLHAVETLEDAIAGVVLISLNHCLRLPQVAAFNVHHHQLIILGLVYSVFKTGSCVLFAVDYLKIGLLLIHIEKQVGDSC